tara:strand:+ start:48 stop:299 length:252 start_codon:yes stop_codon:yes gene_type:complete
MIKKYKGYILSSAKTIAGETYWNCKKEGDEIWQEVYFSLAAARADIDMLMKDDKPEFGKQYSLLSIAQGNTWADSLVKEKEVK